MAKTPGTETITVVRAPKQDWLSDDAPAAATEHDIAGCLVLPRVSHEENRGWVIVDGREVITPFGADVNADDQVRIDGVLWNVDGARGDYKNKRGKGKVSIIYLISVGRTA